MAKQKEQCLDMIAEIDEFLVLENQLNRQKSTLTLAIQLAQARTT